jgi:RNA 2',3'-cyclic 3'-phosphodiesterase
MTAPRLRLFVAFDVPMDHRRRLAEATEQMRTRLTGARWTRVEDQHVTLKFIGWVDENVLAAVGDATRAVAAGHVAAEMELAGLGAFPSRARARVLWAGIEDPQGLGAALADDLSSAFEPLGVEREARRFTPHLTLARFGRPQRLDEAGSQVDLGPLPGFLVSDIVIYRSHLSSKGARYEVIEKCPLA